MASKKFEPVIGLEVHAELNTKSKMFCACPVVDSVNAAPNTAVCAVCSGMPGVLPVVNEQAVSDAILVGLALHCEINETSIFERKNYFYPDLPKGYQISQYQMPLAEHGYIRIRTSGGLRNIQINRVHVEEDAGKLTHVVGADGEQYSLVDLNRAGVPLLEIVTEPDLFTLEEMRAYALELRAILRVLGVNSGDLEKGVIRFEANISMRPEGSDTLGKRVEIKNLNSFRAMERAVAYEMKRQHDLLAKGNEVAQETRGWSEKLQETYIMRSKEDAHDYRYFPEPDLPPLVVLDEWVEKLRQKLPELPRARTERFISEYLLTVKQAELLVSSYAIADFFEAVMEDTTMPARNTAGWILDSIFAWLNEHGKKFSDLEIRPEDFAEFLNCVHAGEINRSTGLTILFEMLGTGKTARSIIDEKNLGQVSDANEIEAVILAVLNEHNDEVNRYRAGKIELLNWFFGQVMKTSKGKANPTVVRETLNRLLGDR